MNCVDLFGLAALEPTAAYARRGPGLDSCHACAAAGDHWAWRRRKSAAARGRGQCGGSSSVGRSGSVHGNRRQACTSPIVLASGSAAAAVCKRRDEVVVPLRERGQVPGLAHQRWSARRRRACRGRSALRRPARPRASARSTSPSRPACVLIQTPGAGLPNPAQLRRLRRTCRPAARPPACGPGPAARCRPSRPGCAPKP